MAGAVFIVMGVSGSGKTSVGEAIAQQQQVLFIDGDDLHPQANIDKMSRGIPLTDEDRLGWLDTIIQEALAVTGKGEKVVITCSALKQQYRDQLRTGIGSITFCILKRLTKKFFSSWKAGRGILCQ
ncbi:gluconokinase, GntK/IdnK-type [Niabella sp. W65]|nr:gluconokinase, GntK/IdnK-type [Niabella sp. W65]MCH7366285.1 gluconokinase, GntK/IdnK-type [Niabella sp. W65]ULT42008.1 gluconokinase, GntK/IdnK-type [Niabella sp. I65]